MTPGQLRLTFSDGRRHDLPPKWDGRVVKWSPWGASRLFVCGPASAVAPPPCSGCGSTHSQAMSRGTVHPLAGETFEYERDRVKVTRSGREYISGVQVVAVRVNPRVQLYAYRCPDCGLDVVLDVDSRECWDLDDSDYGDDGSVAP